MCTFLSISPKTGHVLCISPTQMHLSVARTSGELSFPPIEHPSHPLMHAYCTKTHFLCRSSPVDERNQRWLLVGDKIWTLALELLHPNASRLSTPLQLVPLLLYPPLPLRQPSEPATAGLCYCNSRNQRAGCERRRRRAVGEEIERRRGLNILNEWARTERRVEGTQQNSILHSKRGKSPGVGPLWKGKTVLVTLSSSGFTSSVLSGLHSCLENEAPHTEYLLHLSFSVLMTADCYCLPKYIHCSFSFRFGMIDIFVLRRLWKVSWHCETDKSCFYA